MRHLVQLVVHTTYETEVEAKSGQHAIELAQSRLRTSGLRSFVRVEEDATDWTAVSLMSELIRSNGR